MEAEYGETVGKFVGWVSSFWGSPPANIELTERLIDPTENRIGTMPEPERQIWNPEESTGPVYEPPEPAGIEMTDMAAEEETVIWNPPVREGGGIEMSDLNPLTKQEEALAEVEEKVDELLEDALEPTYQPSQENQDLIDFMEEEWGMDVRP